mgnify:CR=1 FL=1
MDTDVLRQIRSINNQFYQNFADSFAETRGRLQPGVEKLLPSVLGSKKVLDLGCGNGELATILLERGFKGDYLGIDLSARMLEIAQSKVGERANIAFTHTDLGLDSLETVIPDSVDRRFQPPYDHQLSFATLHHIPGSAVRESLIRELHDLSTEGARLSLSVWNFMESDRLRERVVPWEEVGLTERQVEPGDHLIDWRRDGVGLRYVHHFTEDELSTLARQAGFEVEQTFYSDGETGTLGLYQVWIT